MPYKQFFGGDFFFLWLLNGVSRKFHERSKKHLKQCSKVSTREQHQIKRHSLRNRFDSSQKIKEKLNLHVTRRTVQNVLKDMRIAARKPRKKPLLSKTHVKDRLAWAKKYESWTVLIRRECYFLTKH